MEAATDSGDEVGLPHEIAAHGGDTYRIARIVMLSTALAFLSFSATVSFLM